MRIGVVGAGVIGQLRARSIREHPETQLAAVFDPAQSAAERAVGGTAATAFTSLEPFLDSAMDAVVVSSPIHLHEDACLGSLARGRHLLCEKPLSNTVESCRRIVDAAHEHDRVLAVGFNLRYYPAIRMVKDVITSGRIGDLDHLRIFGGDDGLSKFKVDWQYRAPESGGGVTMDVGIHTTDLARYLLGDITQVSGVMSESVWHLPGSEDNAMAVFKNPEGIAASYHATWSEWKGYRVFAEAYGSHGMVRGYYAPMQNLLITYDRPGGVRTTRRMHYPWIRLREKLFSWHTTALISFKDELDDFLAMTSGKHDVPLADGHDGLRAVEVSQAIRTSSESGQVVHLPPLGRMRQ